MKEIQFYSFIETNSSITLQKIPAAKQPELQLGTKNGYGYQVGYPGTSIMGTSTRFGTRVRVLIWYSGTDSGTGLQLCKVLTFRLKYRYSVKIQNIFSKTINCSILLQKYKILFLKLWNILYISYNYAARKFNKFT